MIQQTKPVWQKALTNLVTDPEQLFQLLDLDANYLEAAKRACELFPLRVPQSFIQTMEKGNINDPLLKQILPLGAEFTNTPGFSADPLSEKQINPLPGLLHKYHGRVLLTISGACAVNCRYCFRREFAYTENNPGSKGWSKVIDYIAADNSIEEVIYSGGDPLTASDLYLQRLTEKIKAIPHIKRLRIHTRLPIMIPERICDEFIHWFTQTNMQPILVLHCNHPNEITEHVKQKLNLLKAKGVTLLNQAVLLKGINDEAKVLIKLSENLFECNVLPYYLHLLDRVNGTAHFEVDEAHALSLIKAMNGKLPGYLVPKLVREISGEKNKTSIYY